MKQLAVLALAMMFCAMSEVVAETELILDSRIVWQDRALSFGGYSGLEVIEGGARLLSVSDRGTWIFAELERHDGRLTGILTSDSGPLRGIAGLPLEGYDVDAEGVTINSRGNVYLSYEAFHRVRKHEWVGNGATEVVPHPDFPRLQNNSGLEALAFDASDTLYAIPERSGSPTRPFTVYRLRGETWDTELSLPRDGGFLVAGADFGPDGKLYLLERDFAWIKGFATRIRRFALSDVGFGAGETLLQTDFGALDNMEGISVWKDAEGTTRITMISDDNFFVLQQTIVVEYLVRD